MWGKIRSGSVVWHAWPQKKVTVLPLHAEHFDDKDDDTSVLLARPLNSPQIPATEPPVILPSMPNNAVITRSTTLSSIARSTDDPPPEYKSCITSLSSSGSGRFVLPGYLPPLASDLEQP